MLLEIILNWTTITLDVLWLLYIFQKKKRSALIWLICDSLPFYAHVHTCSPNCTDEEEKKKVDSQTVCLKGC